MHRGIRPISRLNRVAVFDRVVVDVIAMRGKVRLVTNGVLPESPLPNASLAFGITFCGYPLANQRACKARLDCTPAPGRIIIPRREPPDRVQMVRHYHDGIGTKGVFCLDVRIRGTQQINMLHQRAFLPVAQGHGKEKRAAGNQVASIQNDVNAS